MDGLLYDHVGITVITLCALLRMTSQPVSVDTEDNDPIASLDDPNLPFGNKHYEENDCKEKFYPEEASVGSNASPVMFIQESFDQKRLDLRLVKWVICAKKSFRVVEHPAFKDLLNELQPKYKMPNRMTIAKGVLELFILEKEKVKRQLSGVRVSITTDTWTSVEDINYMVVTAHFLDEEWNLHKRIISFKKIISHSGDDLGEILDACLSEWDIHKVFSITLDSAPDKDGLIDYIKRRLSSRGTLLLDGNYFHMRCACHIINSIVNDGIKAFVSSVEGIQNCVKFIHSSPARLDLFRGFAVSENMSNMATIGMDVVARWNATYKMLDSAYKYKHVFSKMAEECDDFKAYFQEKVTQEIDGENVQVKREGPPNLDNWTKALNLSHFLKSFYMITNLLSDTKGPTSNMILTCVLSLQIEILKKKNDSTDSTLQSLAENMEKKFEKYWGSVDEVCPIMFVAQVLDPRLKLDMLDVLLPEIHASAEKREKIKALTKKHLNILYLEYKEESMEESTPREDVAGSGGLASASCSSTSDAMQKLALMRKAKSLEITNEVDKYLNDPSECATDKSFVLLDWWKYNRYRYPVLSKVAKDVFAIPSTSGTSESAFRVSGRVIDPFWAWLPPMTVQALVCMSNWFNGDDFPFNKEPTEEENEFYKELEQIEMDVITHEVAEDIIQDTTPFPSVVEVQQACNAHPLPPRPPRVDRTLSNRGGRTPSNVGGRSKRGRLN